MIKKQKVRRSVQHPHIRKDDKVVVISGENSGKTGRVLSVNPEKGTAVVEGLNMIKKHIRPNKNVGKGGIVDKEGPIALSNLCLLVDDKRTHAKMVENKAKESPNKPNRVRVDAKTGENL
ncbi:MAG: 50S ribosomal protein L24 [Candidatus Riflebacteria bacterium]|nr:50S ribosomal protein L24 [Candidatus Riflebacteria bacterium]